MIRVNSGLIYLTAMVALLEVESAIDISLESTRCSGVAPLAVLFDASATNATTTVKPFHDLEYHWNFGDPHDEDWLVGVSGKNTAIGPIAGHVFEYPGSYSVILDVSGGAEVESDTITITVYDPDDVFSGSDTICFSNLGDFTGAPEGALLVTTENFEEIIGHMGPNRRLLLRRGETWNADPTGDLDICGPGILGAFGPGINKDEYGIFENNPQILGAVFSLSAGVQVSPDTVNTYDWRIMDLVFRETDDEAVFGARGEFHHVLFFRTKIMDCFMGMCFPGSVLEYYNENYDQDFEPFYAISVVQCRFSDFYLAPIYADVRSWMLLGSELKDSEDSHVTRFPYIGTGLISNNDMSGPRTTGHIIKLHAPPVAGNWLYPPGTYSENIVIAENRFEGSIEDWPVAVAPQNALEFEYQRDVIIERNYFLCNQEQWVALYLSSYETTVRNNIFNGNDEMPWRRAIEVTNRNPGMPIPDDITIYNNTFTTQGGWFDVMGLTGTNLEVKNNLAYAPDDGDFGGTGDVSNNLLTMENPFTVPVPMEPDDFIPHGTSGARDAGTPMPSWVDFFVHQRPHNGSWDIGAVETGEALWDITAMLQGGVLVLRWGSLAGGYQVDVYRDTIPSIVPDTTNLSNHIAVVPFEAFEYTSDFGIGDSDLNAFYRIIGVDNQNREICRSIPLGEIDYDVVIEHLTP